MAYEMVMPYHLHMPSYFLETFTEYPKKGTGLDDMELASAIGWLAREDKIQFELQYPNGKEKKAYVYLMLNVYF